MILYVIKIAQIKVNTRRMNKSYNHNIGVDMNLQTNFATDPKINDEQRP